ncbi:hypothetical protein EDEG_02485 [Edhazardia aedis USNM 41457]|uniref:Uncharacterized protein n=1 Tax=Edhazardia aedis (strain USNM 41457) TaxID=1003232 RepID=J9DP85_EDHAE|nr:hypothetical protein EDEG_02485 [Edhazardia aedis USNM 41457]|eukprot:EJW03147.1 hypothetical protein EDEG_02485 [Edhazardia aedis USNM 41457]
MKFVSHTDRKTRNNLKHRKNITTFLTHLCLRIFKNKHLKYKFHLFTFVHQSSRFCKFQLYLSLFLFQYGCVKKIYRYIWKIIISSYTSIRILIIYRIKKVAKFSPLYTPKQYCISFRW